MISKKKASEEREAEQGDQEQKDEGRTPHRSSEISARARTSIAIKAYPRTQPVRARSQKCGRPEVQIPIE